jgi:recombinational DNA repair protein (RecF pathway)
MAGEIIKTTGTVLAIHPWSRTSHVVAWLTPDHGVVSTLVKGAVRAKSALPGQYDLFYTCDLIYYARASGDLHPLREATPSALRDALRGRWRETSIAGYASSLVRDLAPPGAEASDWFDFLETLLDALAADSPPAPPAARLVEAEMGILRLAGLAPDFSGMDPNLPWTPFAIDHGRCGSGARTVRVTPSAVAALASPSSYYGDYESLADAVRFLGHFLAYHLDTPPDVRRSLVQAVMPGRPAT